MEKKEYNTDQNKPLAEDPTGNYPKIPEEIKPKNGKVIYKPMKGYSYNPLLRLPRNMKCPCQSGIKFKKCCMKTLPGAIKTEDAIILAKALKEIEAGRYYFDLKSNQIKHINLKNKVPKPIIKHPISKI